ncbi:hypothetical protein D3C71_1301210 [compost metagenome]
MVLIHKEADGSTIHTENRNVLSNMVMDCPEHRTIAAEYDNGIGLIRIFGDIVTIEEFPASFRSKNRIRRDEFELHKDLLFVHTLTQVS